MAHEILAVNEIFGPTVQGEGKNVGMPCAFLRLAGCNLACVWCDTPYAWDWARFDAKKEIHSRSVESVFEQLMAMKVRSLVVSGGEPMLQQRALYGLTRKLIFEGWWIEIETAGTIKPMTTEMANQFNVSPKLAHSGNEWHKRYNAEALKTFAVSWRSIFKFVVQRAADFEEIDALVKDFGMRDVYIMAEGTDDATLNARAQEVAALTIARGYWLSPRLHVSLYGSRRGI